ncbi:MAG TPA: PQQ-binding-like beta-propeller repeat protein [Steroidobacteraceae bacterium]|nr:PQQ-binding-like beta-propeller repeat protein [Steroidobacteraceae bacterium]
MFGTTAQAQAQNFFDSGPVSFTADQAARGQVAYNTNCGSCHGGHLDDGQFAPAVKGAAFKTQWSNQSSAALFSLIRTTMPPTAPGNLSNQTYADIEAYLLAANGAAPGSSELAAAPAPSSSQGLDLARQGPPRAGQPRPRGFTLGNDAIYQAALAQRQSVLGGLTDVTDAMLRHPPDSDWLVWRRTYDNIGFSPLKQINKRDIRDLRAAWSLSLPVSANEGTPLEHDGVLFVESGNTIDALDGTNGDVLWQYVRALPEGLQNGQTARMKNMAIYRNMLYAPTPDGHIVALDVKSGKVIWDQEVITAAQGMHAGEVDGNAYHMSGGPLVAHGKVIVGVSLGVYNRGGDYVVGLDAQTGQEIWRFHTIEQAPPGEDSWNGAPVDQRFGSGVWESGSYDPDLNLVYLGTGNTYDVDTLLQPHTQPGKSNDGLYTESTLALNPDTGKLAWYYQHMNRDVWDLDWVFEQSLITLPIDGKPTKLVVTGGKIAIFDALRRGDGHYEFSRDLGIQNLVSSIDPKTGRKIIRPDAEPVANRSALVCPTGMGARSWPATSFDPGSAILYVPLLRNLCSNTRWVPRAPAAVAEGGAGGGGGGFALKPGADGNFGGIEALDLKSGKVLWNHLQRSPIASSMLATAGGVVFSGSRDRYFRALDASSGKMLWQTRLNASPSSSPITYSVAGRQYVAVITGGGGPLDAFSGFLIPELHTPTGGITLWVFELPDTGHSP